MELAFVLTLIPAIVILFAPRRSLKYIIILTALLFTYGAYQTWDFSNTCQSDGCIGIGILGALTGILGVAALIAGAIRWLVIYMRKRRAKTGDA